MQFASMHEIATQGQSGSQGKNFLLKNLPHVMMTAIACRLAGALADLWSCHCVNGLYQPPPLQLVHRNGLGSNACPQYSFTPAACMYLPVRQYCMQCCPCSISVYTIHVI